MDGLNREIEIRFGTNMPVPFKDARTGMDLELKAFGDAMVVVKDPAKYPTIDDVKKTAPLVLKDAFMKAVTELDGTLEASALKHSTNKIERIMAEKVSSQGLMATSVKLMQIVLTSESEEKVKKAILSTPMTDDHPNPQVLPNPSIHPMTDNFPAGVATTGAMMFPKFCTNCGAKAGSRFCPECGAKLV